MYVRSCVNQREREKDSVIVTESEDERKSDCLRKRERQKERDWK
jgi:hypothetical protein